MRFVEEGTRDDGSTVGVHVERVNHTDADALGLVTPEHETLRIGAGGSGGRESGAGAGAGGDGRGGSGALFQCPSGPFGAPLPAGVEVERVEGLPPLDAFNDMGRTRTNVEGPVWIDGALYVSEFPFTPAPSSRILRLALDGSVSVALTGVGSNGLALDGSGALIATDHQQGAIVRFTFPLGAKGLLTAAYDGARFNSPNDLAVRSDGTVYFSDPSYQAPNPPPQRQTRVYRLPPGSSEPAVVDATRSQPNGVTLSLDERALYVSGSDGIFAYPIAADGSIAPGSGARLSGFSGNSDGLALDCAGNLYATAGKRVVILSPAGDEIGTLSVNQAENVTNLAFGGRARTTLFITSFGRGDQRGVFKAELAIPGLPY